MKLFMTSVNAIMSVDETFVETSNYERQMTGVMSKKEKVLKSYMPENNVLWSHSERDRRFEEFERDNKGLIGKGDTILSLSDEGVLTEYYSGVQVIPAQSHSISAQGSNLGEASYYGINQDADISKLYVPISWLREINESDALSILVKLFDDKERDIENEIIKPLQNRDALAKRNSMTQGNVEPQIDESNYVDEVPMHHNR